MSYHDLRRHRRIVLCGCVVVDLLGSRTVVETVVVPVVQSIGVRWQNLTIVESRSKMLH